MSSRSFRALRLAGLPAVLVTGGFVLSGAAPPDGPVPDFSSNGIAWTGGVGRDFMAVPGSPSPNRQDPAHPFIPNNSGKQPTYRMADLSNPNLKQWVKDVMKQDNDEVLAGKIAFTPRQSCKPAGVPAFMLFGGGNLHFMQTPQEVTIIFDGDQQVRHIYMDVPHSKNPQPSWYGESVGHYEGDELVVDTIGLNSKTFVDAYCTPHTGKLHVIERWKTIDSGNQLEVTMTIDDPDAFNQVWKAAARYHRVQTPYVEEVCA
jgi:hypothetical protein